MGSLAFCLFQSISPGRNYSGSIIKKFSSWVLSLFVTIEWTQTCVLYHPTNQPFERKKTNHLKPKIHKTENCLNILQQHKNCLFWVFGLTQNLYYINKKLYCHLSQKKFYNFFLVSSYTKVLDFTQLRFPPRKTK